MNLGLEGQPLQPDYLVPGTMIGPYAIVRRLGLGSHGVVYKVQRGEHVYALKICRFHPRGRNLSAMLDRRFRREIVCLEQLEDILNVPGIFAHDRFPDAETGFQYFVEELVEGAEPIQHWAAQRTPSLFLLTDVVRRLFETLGDIHDAGVIHRDIKPANILMDSDESPQIIDFGIASCFSVEGLTEPHDTLGTPGYMSPEQCRWILRPIEERLEQPFEYLPAGDLHAMGLVFYELLTGLNPFNLTLPNRLLFQQVAEIKPRRPSELNPNVPFVLDKVLMQLLAKDPAERPVDGKAAAEELNRILDKVAGASWKPPFVVPIRERQRTTFPGQTPMDAGPPGSSARGDEIDSAPAPEAPPDTEAAATASDAPRPEQEGAQEPRSPPAPEPAIERAATVQDVASPGSGPRAPEPRAPARLRVRPGLLVGLILASLAAILSWLPRGPEQAPAKRAAEPPPPQVTIAAPVAPPAPPVAPPASPPASPKGSAPLKPTPPPVKARRSSSLNTSGPIKATALATCLGLAASCVGDRPRPDDSAVLTQCPPEARANAVRMAEKSGCNKNFDGGVNISLTPSGHIDTSRNRRFELIKDGPVTAENNFCLNGPRLLFQGVAWSEPKGKRYYFRFDQVTFPDGTTWPICGQGSGKLFDVGGRDEKFLRESMAPDVPPVLPEGTHIIPNPTYNIELALPERK